MTIKQKVKRAEKLCDWIFFSVYGYKFDFLKRPDDIMSPYDVIACKGNIKTIWELKYSSVYNVGDFIFEGAMIEIDKWNNLIKYVNKGYPVYYARFYRDGYAVWYLNEININDCSVTYYERKQVTVSDSNKIKKTKCLLLPFDKAMQVSEHNLDYIKDVNAIKDYLFKRGRKKPLKLGYIDKL